MRRPTNSAPMVAVWWRRDGARIDKGEIAWSPAPGWLRRWSVVRRTDQFASYMHQSRSPKCRRGAPGRRAHSVALLAARVSAAGCGSGLGRSLLQRASQRRSAAVFVEAGAIASFHVGNDMADGGRGPTRIPGRGIRRLNTSSMRYSISMTAIEFRPRSSPGKVMRLAHSRMHPASR